MAIDRSDFLILASTLAAGGAGGWFFRDRSPDMRPPPPAPAPARPCPSAAPSAAVPPWPSAVAIVDSKAATACDDSQGSPEQCPSIGPADEGICGNVIYKRCQEFKTTFKPRVASQAVACLRALKGQERCDPLRIHQCGHMALMAACPDATPPLKGQLSTASEVATPTVTLVADPNVPATPVVTACENILTACKSAPLGPTFSDCRQTLAGLNEVGLASMIDCVSSHCTDRGLYLCEGVPKKR